MLSLINSCLCARARRIRPSCAQLWPKWPIPLANDMLTSVMILAMGEKSLAICENALLMGFIRESKGKRRYLMAEVRQDMSKASRSSTKREISPKADGAKDASGNASSDERVAQDAKANLSARYHEVVRLSILGIVANVVLTIFKGAVGIMAGSVAIVMDAVNSLTDAFSSIATIIGEKIAAMRPTRKYPYGYGRVEYVTSIVIAAVIMAAGIVSIWESAQKVIHPTPPDYQGITLIVLIVAIAVKVFLAIKFMAAGKRISSQPLRASGIDALYDAILTAGTLACALVCMLWGIDLDGWVGVLISIFVVKAGIDVLREAVSSIIGERVDAEKSRKVRDIIASHEGVLGVYDLMIDTFGPEFMFCAANIEVREDMPANKAYELTHHISEDLYRECNARTILGIYAQNSTDEYADIRKHLDALIARYPEILQVHGFYVDAAKQHVDFDMVIDFDHDPDEVCQRIVQMMMEGYPDYTFSVFPDLDYAMD